jgi:hypothetical protein
MSKPVARIEHREIRVNIEAWSGIVRISLQRNILLHCDARRSSLAALVEQRPSHPRRLDPHSPPTS